MTALAVPSGAMAKLPSVLTQGHPLFKVKPAVISYTGDGTAVVGGPDGTSARHLGRLRWTTYNVHQGIAVGLLWLDDCKPNCAAGTFSPRKVNVHVFWPSARHRFRRLTLRYVYRGRSEIVRLGIRFYGGIGGFHGFWGYAAAQG
jgi:hypothetical protein